jgi:COX assembly protein 2
MHPHLHTEESQKSILPYYAAERFPLTHIDCGDVIAILEECHARGFMWKVFGNCTDAKHKVNLCLRAQRLDRTAMNRQIAKEKREHIKKVWAEIDENS